jgi:hypothetical protein
VRDFAVGALELFEEVERGARACEVAVGVERERRPERVAAEEPCEAGALGLARRAEARDEAAPEQGVLDKALVNADLRPVESLVDARVRRRDVGRLFEQTLVVRDILLIQLARAREEPHVGHARLLAPLHAPRDDDGDEARLRLGGRHVQLELRGHVARLLLVGHDRDVERGRAADHPGEAPRLFVDEVGALLLVPRERGRSRAGGPHQAQARAEARGDGERERRVNVEEHDDARLVERRENYLADGEGGVRVGDGGRLRAHVNGGGDVGAAEFERVAFEAE